MKETNSLDVEIAKIEVKAKRDKLTTNLVVVTTAATAIGLLGFTKFVVDKNVESYKLARTRIWNKANKNKGGKK